MAKANPPAASAPRAPVPTVVKKISRAGIVEIYDALADVKSAFDNVMHNYTAAAMRKQMAPTVDVINEMRTDADKSKPTEYMTDRENLVRSFSLTDKDGRPLVAQSQYVIDPERKAEFETAAITLREKHKESIDKHEDVIKKTNEFLRESVEFELPRLRLRLSWFKKNMKPETLEILFDLIEMDLPEEVATAIAAEATAKVEKKAKAEG